MSKSAGKSMLFGISYCFLQYLYRGKDKGLQLIIYKILKGDSMSQNQNELRDKLNGIIAKGLTAKAVSSKTGITPDIISRFRNKHICLCDSDSDKLWAYLEKVVIP